jgi:hypothetical protein
MADRPDGADTEIHAQDSGKDRKMARDGAAMPGFRLMNFESNADIPVAHANISERPSGTSRARILLIEDDLEIAEQVGKELVNRAYMVHHAATGSQGADEIPWTLRRPTTRECRDDDHGTVFAALFASNARLIEGNLEQVPPNLPLGEGRDAPDIGRGQRQRTIVGGERPDRAGQCCAGPG